jgi:ADP-heptose:LPS heptosyltransferase
MRSDSANHAERALLVAAGGGLGDTLLAGVVAEALRERYVVDALVQPAHRALAERIPAIADVYLMASPIPTAEEMRGPRYAASIVTWATFATAVVPLLAEIPVRVGQSRRLYSAFFTDRVSVRSETGDRHTHWTDILLDYVRPLGGDVAPKQPRFVPTAADEAEAVALLAARGIEGPFALLHPTRGLSAARERWPAAGFIALARALEATHGIPVLVTGAPADAPFAEAIARGVEEGVTSIAGATSIGAFGALAARARYVVAMDSGPMHVAAAMGAPTVGIFALQSDEPDRWAPRGPRTAVVRATYPCPPADRKETCPTFLCVRHLDLAAILLALDGLLQPLPEPAL